MPPDLLDSIDNAKHEAQFEHSLVPPSSCLTGMLGTEEFSLSCAPLSYADTTSVGPTVENQSNKPTFHRTMWSCVMNVYLSWAFAYCSISNNNISSHENGFPPVQIWEPGYCYLRQHGLAWNSWQSSCLSLLNTGTTGMSYHTKLKDHWLKTYVFRLV